MTRMSLAARRAALVEAAIRVVARDGVAAASTRAVTAEAGMPLSSLHYAFDSFDALMAAVVTEVTESERRAAVDVLLPFRGADDEGAAHDDAAGGATPALTLEQALVMGLDRYVDLLVADPQREITLAEMSTYAQRTGQLDALAARYDRYLAVAADALDEGARATGHRWTVPLEEAATELVTVLDGVTTTWLARRDTPAARRSVRHAARLLASLAEPAPLPESTRAD
jgi:DNA-binding transcriptional regulator YbjK